MKLLNRTDAKIELLGQVDLFRGCTKKELAQIAALADVVEVAEGTVLVQEGRPGQEAFVIGEGCATVSMEGREIAELGPGAFFGEMALLDRGPRTATVTAATPMHLFVLDGRSFSSLISQTPTVVRKMLRTVAERLRSFEQHAM